MVSYFVSNAAFMMLKLGGDAYLRTIDRASCNAEGYPCSPNPIVLMKNHVPKFFFRLIFNKVNIQALKAKCI